MSLNWIKLLYDKHLKLSRNERDQLYRMVQNNEIDPGQLEIALITLMIRTRREGRQKRSSEKNTFGLSNTLSSNNLLSLWGGHENQWLSDVMLVSSVVIASFGVNVILSRYPKQRQHYWENSVDKVGFEFCRELTDWCFISDGYRQEDLWQTENNHDSFIQRFYDLSSDYRHIAYSGLLHCDVSFVHMMVSHRNYQQPAIDLVSELSLKKGLVLSSDLLNLNAVSKKHTLKEVNEFGVYDCFYDVNYLTDFFGERLHIGPRKFSCQKCIIDDFFDGNINHNFGLGVIIHAASALYARDVFSSFYEASEAVVQSLKSKQPKLMREKLLSYNYSEIHWSAHR